MSKIKNLLSILPLVALTACSSTPRYMASTVVHKIDNKYCETNVFSPGQEFAIKFLSVPHLSRAAIDIEESRDMGVQFIDPVGVTQITKDFQYKKDAPVFGWREVGIVEDNGKKYNGYLKLYTAPINEGDYRLRIYSQSQPSLLRPYSDYATLEFTVQDLPKTNSAVTSQPVK